ncbi:dethiobiotin synthase [Oceanobacter sp. 4_MG-2023]|uniref:dethiobiotin synthase n=1 Tax=Oceanobacter sp. 4_MG-2023 TaxID=3062623 RepID=UPI0027333673|nr:dethiobiotin synthase [Oceanobacter sp. 4_MG-2023]MDP2547303.1 dethiobiotin synthase [Oceanobacter sp. 4_MG-2023]
MTHTTPPSATGPALPPRRLFITGTDTDVGKTLVSAALLAAATRAGYRTFGLKPVAAGCTWMASPDQPQQPQWCNDDALLLQRFSSVEQPYTSHNPVAFQAAIAPHIAARQEQRPLHLDQLTQVCINSLDNAGANFELIEGAGGWLVPINTSHSLADLAVAIDRSADRQPLEVILVVGLRLGCINHALLSVEAIRARGLTLTGWIANSLNPSMVVEQDNLDYLTEVLSQQRIPLLDHVPYQSTLASPDDLSIQQAVDTKAEAAMMASQSLAAMFRE